MQEATASAIAEVQALQTWLSTCMDGVLSLASCADARYVVVETDVQAELEVLHATLDDLHGVVTRPQTVALSHLTGATKELVSFLQTLHAAYLEDQKRWLPFTKKATESVHLLDALVGRLQRRTKRFLSVLAIPGSPAPKAVADVDPTTPHTDELFGSLPAEDRPIESTFIKYHQKYVADLAKQDALHRSATKQKRRQTLATMQSPVRKQPRYSEDLTRPPIQ
ncbi:hypothetical protein SPRG_18430 [Saprolegnia parasitica CBS 223.65]|uniref:Uncharacterized protein n=1 Tax=Saprolegnia parasitica (strain CBS 223.65) TaxID=695850 RepID=A0A067BD35_SAPPC|nr:hypothetical protein SPRG_18430 [Saprolegnia parasitica CBS 223.65]KDO16033.1 hypothetical protein SPRG_18430 [Saprolegnia parasitica CBS 223.65]|eukprot:XP_012213258.1 hypothetical protein SPRG_18430 [Saprolegnia parasitica CBS 223.65]